jgi:hypothetical protein
VLSPAAKHLAVLVRENVVGLEGRFALGPNVPAPLKGLENLISIQ